MGRAALSFSAGGSGCGGPGDSREEGRGEVLAFCPSDSVEVKQDPGGISQGFPDGPPLAGLATVFVSFLKGGLWISRVTPPWHCGHGAGLSLS